MTSNNNKSRIAPAVLPAVIGSLLIYLLSIPAFGQDQALPEEVEKRISSTVREYGMLQSASHIEIRSEVPGNNTILHLVPEGTRVKKGDFILRLDSSNLEQQLSEKQILTAEAESNLAAAQMKLKQASKSRIRLAEIIKLHEKTASLEENAMIGGDGEIALEKEALVAKQKLLERRIEFISKRLEIVGSNKNEEIENAQRQELELMEARSDLTQCLRKLAFIDKVYLPSRTATVQLKSAKALFELESEVAGLAQQVVDHKTAVVVAKQKLRITANDLSETKKNIERCTMLAPGEGIVVYSNERSRAGTEWAPEEGALVRERQSVVTLTDYKKLEVKTLINESRIASIRVGQTAKLKFEALPNLEIKGIVTGVSRFPEPGGWMQSDTVRKYSATVAIVDPSESLRIGMSALVEITTQPDQSSPKLED